MKIVLTLVSFSLLMFTLGVARPQQHASESCDFAVQGESAHATVTGPDDILPLVYVVEQPDSPIELVSVDLTGMWLSVSNEQHTEQDCAKYKIRNRSDRTIQKSEIMLMLSTTGGAGGGSGALTSSPLSPGQTIEVESCGVRGHGSATDNYVRLLVYVRSVDFGDCLYKPSLRIPRSLKVHPVW
jgi:hypothetical protein